MPIGKRAQSSAMLYTLITFVGLFIIATTFAVIYYVKAEKQRTIAADSQSKLGEMATDVELRKTGTLVGAKQPRKSRLGTMLDYLDEMVGLVTGGVPEETSAEVKVESASRKARETLELLAGKYPDIGSEDPNTTGLIRLLEKLKTKLDNTEDAYAALQQQLENLKNRFDDAMAASLEKEQTLLAEKEKYQQQVNDIQKNYNELKALTEQTAEQQVQILMAQRDQEREGRNNINQELLKSQAELRMAEDRIKHFRDNLQEIMPPPDSEVAAFKPDGKIILLDEQNKIVHLNIGSNDHVYQGLTFSVYEKNMPIPKDGKGKAEIEVFSVEKDISSARITHSQIKRHVVVGDIVANLIWDSDKTSVFAIAGEFDLDGDGEADYNAVDKLKALIEKWGGRAIDNISVNTDFLVLGSTPEVLKKPTFEQMEVDPMAMEKYQSSLQKFEQYQQIQSQAQALSVPILNIERFLYFIGYKTQSTRAGAF